MRKLAADFILDPDGNLIPGYTLITDDQGKIIDLTNLPVNDAEYYPGLLCPGFINTHGHLELSYLLGKVPPGHGLSGFIKDLVAARKKDAPEILPAVVANDELMWKQGIQACGDISNSEDTFSIKQFSPIRYHTFIELFNFNSSEAGSTFQNGKALYLKAKQSHPHVSIVPHAPYSVTPELFKLIGEFSSRNKLPWSIHNQETASENEMFLQGKGELWDLFRGMSIDLKNFKITGTRSIQGISKYIPGSVNVLLVHNTFTSKEDIDFFKEHNLLNSTWFCICAKANKYIENRLPDINMLESQGCLITIGTDSLASNDTLSVLEELKTIHRFFPKITVAKLLVWATANGADYFKWNDLGKFTSHTSPGVLWITHAGIDGIHSYSEVRRLF